MSEQKLAAPELAAIDIKGVSRQSFIMRGAMAAGSVYGLGAVRRSCGRRWLRSGGGDVGILNFALTLEYLEAAFYTRASSRSAGCPARRRRSPREIRDNENEHVDALTATIKDLGGTPVKAPGVDFGNAFANQGSFLKLAQTFEDTGVSAYNGAAPSDRVDGGARGGRLDRSGRGSTCGRDPRAQRQADHRRRVRQGLEMQAVLDAVKPFVKS